MAPEEHGIPGLGPFLSEVSDRLDALSHAALKERLLAHARNLPPQDRPALLALLETGRDRGGPRDPAVAAEDLAGAAEALVARILALELVDGWGWDDEVRVDRTLRDESWADEMDVLLAAASDAFLRGELELAASVYGPLLRALGRLDGSELPGTDVPEDVLETDLDEACARHLRAVYETTGPADRPDRLLEEIEALRFVGRADHRLSALMEADVTPLSDLNTFLPAWIELLGSRSLQGEPARTADSASRRLLREAVRLRDGLDGLRALARAQGRDHPEAYRDWIEALASGGLRAEAIVASEEALEKIQDPACQARLSDRLAELNAEAGDPGAAVEARRSAWRAEPSLARLLALASEGHPEAPEADARLLAEVERVRAGSVQVSERLRALLELMTGGLLAASERLERSRPLGWSAPDHPGSPCFVLLALSALGQRPPWSGALAELWADLAGEIGLAPGSDKDDGEGRRGAEAAEAILAAVERHAASDEARRDVVLALRKTVERRTTAVVGNKHRGAYSRTAQLGVALAETLTLRGDGAGASAFLEKLRMDQSRHPAFRAALGRIADASPILRPAGLLPREAPGPTPG